MNGFLQKFASKVITKGNLQIEDATGTTHRFGDGAGPPVKLKFHSEAAERSVLMDPELKLGEVYMGGGYDIQQGTVLQLLNLLLDNVGDHGRTWWTTALAGSRFVTERLRENNSTKHARGNVQHHYDLDGRLYDLFLDSDRQYSCAYFADGVNSLEEAQWAKKMHIAGKLDLRPGQRVLDIGSGWGGLGLTLAEQFGVDVTGVTLSDEQFAMSNKRAADRGMSDRVRFLLKDYRHLEGTFDRIVSVGMFEHVGLSHYREFFSHVDRLLAPDGIAMIHTIAKKNDPGPINPWMKKYIFPGAYLPTLSELAPRIEKQNFWLTDLEVWRIHYAETLKHWNERFQKQRDKAKALYDERFCRMWEFYLQVCEMGFRRQGLCVFQMQLAKNINAVPLTRDYMYEKPVTRQAQAAE